MQILTLVIFFLLGYLCITDILYRKIKNICVLAILLCSICMAIYIGHANLSISALVLIVGFLLTLAGAVGAGDVKLLAALSLGIPQEYIGLMFFMTCCVGSPVAVLTLFISRIVFKKKNKTVPFGIAITIGYIIAMLGVF